MVSAPDQPVRTEADYEQALAEIETLFEGQPDTPEGDRLEVLTTLVEAYERMHHPVLPQVGILFLVPLVTPEGGALQE